MKVLIVVVAFMALAAGQELAREKRGLEHGGGGGGHETPIIHGHPVVTKVFETPGIAHYDNGLASGIVHQTVPYYPGPFIHHKPIIHPAPAPIISHGHHY